MPAHGRTAHGDTPQLAGCGLRQEFPQIADLRLRLGERDGELAARPASQAMAQQERGYRRLAWPGSSTACGRPRLTAASTAVFLSYGYR